MDIEIKKIINFKESAFCKTLCEKDLEKFIEHDACFVCKSTELKKIIELGGLSWKKTIDLSQCQSCGHIFYSCIGSQDEILSYYKNDWGSSQGLNKKCIKPAYKITNFLSDLSVTNKELSIIDIGCGEGGSLLALKEHGFLDIFGCEQSVRRSNIAASLGVATVLHGGYQDLDHTRFFDIIYINHVLEHIYDPYDFFMIANSRLNTDGIIVVSVPNAEYESVLGQSIFIPHLHSFTPKSLQLLGVQFGFDCLVWRKPKVSGGDAYYSMTYIFYKSKKHFLIGDNFINVEEFIGYSNDEICDRIKRFWLLSQRRYLASYISSMVQDHGLLSKSFHCLNRFQACGYYITNFARNILKYFSLDKKFYIIIVVLQKLFKIGVFDYVSIKAGVSRCNEECVPRIHNNNKAIIILK